ncbi:hypothetical protein V6N13_050040 [Hibiscus sabdariffa]
MEVPSAANGVAMAKLGDNTKKKIYVKKKKSKGNYGAKLGNLAYLDKWVGTATPFVQDEMKFSTYLPSQTPKALQKYREEELVNIRGGGRKGELKKWDRVYDYAYYNDLGMPEMGSEYERPILGGSSEYPYPRRGKTGRKPNKKDKFDQLEDLRHQNHIPFVRRRHAEAIDDRVELATSTRDRTRCYEQSFHSGGDGSLGFYLAAGQSLCFGERFRIPSADFSLAEHTCCDGTVHNREQPAIERDSPYV